VTSLRALAILAPLCLVAAAASAQPVFVDVQRGYGVTGFGVGTRVGGEKDLWERGAWKLERDWRLRLARWSWNHGNTVAPSLWDVSVYPTLRFERGNGHEALIPYAELGLGAHLLSHARIGERYLGFAFQFGEHAALGLRFGPQHAYSLALRAEHVSNAHLKLPNDGVSFYGVELQYDWR
jgi:lipid A 3-O-deacylase